MPQARPALRSCLWSNALLACEPTLPVSINPNTPENEARAAYTDPPDGQYSGIGSGTADMAIYQLADPQGSVVAVVADAPAVRPRLVDEVEYDPYGRARRTAQGDFNHRGASRRGKAAVNERT